MLAPIFILVIVRNVKYFKYDRVIRDLVIRVIKFRASDV